MIRKWIGAGAGVIILGSALRAQELSWTELETTQEPPQLATGLKMVGRDTPDVPPEIKKLSEIAYAEVTYVTDGKRGIAQPKEATSPWLLPAIDQGLRNFRIKTTDGHELSGSNYDSVRFYLIFNPASAGTRSVDSTPRALSVRSAIFPASMLVKEKGKQGSWTELPKDVFADLSVDASGAVTDVQLVRGLSDKLADAAIAAVKEWKFAPARRGGSPISTTVRVPVLFTWPTVFSLTDLTRAPRAVKQEKPVYPFSERLYRFNGEVVLDFVVSKTGDVKDVVVHQSNNPNLNEAAIEAVRRWKFEPGYLEGRAVNVRMRVPMIFELDGNSGKDRYEISKGKPTKLPPELQYDFPPKVKNAAMGVYPFEQLQKKTRAKVTVLFAVRPDGKVKFIEDKNQILSDFDRAARAMVEEFEFVPASKDGKPTWGMLKLEVAFEPGSDQVIVSDSARHILRELQKKDAAIFLLNQVEHKPEPLSRRAPVFPSELREQVQDGKAVIEFFIDEEGKVQLPHVISSTHPSFGYAAVQAVSQWEFKPLTHSGKPVVVRAQVPMVFGGQPQKKTPEQDEKPVPDKQVEGS